MEDKVLAGKPILERFRLVGKVELVTGAGQGDREGLRPWRLSEFTLQVNSGLPEQLLDLREQLGRRKWLSQEGELPCACRCVQAYVVGVP